jgi:hypothetical protein
MLIVVFVQSADVAGAAMIGDALHVTARVLKHILIWRTYQLELEEGMEAIDWQLADDQRLPLGLMFNRKKGTIYGFVVGKRNLEVKLGLIVRDKVKENVRAVKTSCMVKFK